MAWTQETNIKGPPGVSNVPGPQGPPGPQGAASTVPGPGVALGGTTGQVLTKTSATDYATNWQTPSGGGGGITDAPNDANAYVRSALAWAIGYTKAAIDTLLALKLNSSVYTAADVLAKIKTVDGATSGLDADLLDAQDSAYYLSLANSTGTLPAARFDDTAHGARSGGTLHALATPSVAGFMADAASDGTQYVRKNAAWAAVSVPPGTVMSDTAPVSPLPGAFWWNTLTGALNLWFQDANSSQWVQVNNIVAIGGVTGGLITIGTSAPSSPSVNDVWIDTT